MGLWLIITSIIIGLFVLFHVSKTIVRKEKRRRFLDNRRALFGINPRHGSKAIYETVDEKMRKVSWLIAQNRTTTAEGIKQYHEMHGVGNDGTFVDTYMHRDMMRNKSVVSLISHVLSRAPYLFRDLTTKIMPKVKVLLKVLAHKALSIMRSFIHMSYHNKHSGGSSDAGADNANHPHY
jgi:hypothetical protein